MKKFVFTRFKKCFSCEKNKSIGLFKNNFNYCVICKDKDEKQAFSELDKYYEDEARKRIECFEVAKNHLSEYQMKELNDYIKEDEENNQIYSFEIKEEKGIPPGDEDIDSSLNIFSSSFSVGESGDSYEGSTYINLNKDNKYLVYHWSC